MKQGENILVGIAKKSSFLRQAYRKMAYKKRTSVFEAYAKKYEIEEKLIIFEAYQGGKYTCSPKAIYEAMIKEPRFDDFTFVWFFSEPKEYENVKALNRAKLVNCESAEYYQWYAKAKYIVTNSIGTKIGTVREGQVYIQTWHGTPLKKLGFDIENNEGNPLNSLKEIGERYQIESKKISYMISPSKFTSEKLNSSFRLSKYNEKAKILETGYPRNDALINSTAEDVSLLKEKLGITDGNKKVILYAPTFRDNNHETGVGYTWDLGFQIDRLKEELGDEFIMLFRTHYFIGNTIDLSQHKDFIINVTNYPEINDLYLVADLLITDYSSVFFDYAVLKRPIIYYMYDLAEYRDDVRGFYLDLNELPGDIVEKEEDLIESIRNTARFKLDDKYKEFNEKYNYLEDGNASKRVIDQCIVVK